jgi:hypothetical protein
LAWSGNKCQNRNRLILSHHNPDRFHNRKKVHDHRQRKEIYQGRKSNH